MKNISFLFCVFFAVNQLIGQPTFEKTYGTIDDDRGYSVSICDDNSYIICGNVSNLYTGDKDIYTAKINIYGDTIWTRVEGTEYNSDVGYSVKQTFDNGYIITGYKYDLGDSYPYLLKYDAAGNKEWIKNYSAYAPSGIAYTVIQTIDSGYAFCGIFDIYSNNKKLWQRKVFLLRTNKDGEYMWDKTFGSSGTSYGKGLVQSSDGGFVICGLYDTPGEYHDAWLFKTDQNGNLNWNKTFGGSSSCESAWDVKETEDGGYILCGNKYDGFILMDGEVYVIKTDEFGNKEWSKTYGTNDDNFNGIAVDNTNDGGFIFCCNKKIHGENRNIWLIRTDSNGDTLWTKTYGGIYDDGASDICTTEDGGFIVCGYTRNLGIGGSDIYLFKTDSYGVITYIKENTGEMEKIKIAPNPTRGMFFIRNSPTILKYKIFSINGNLLLEGKRNNFGSVEIDISTFLTGIYFLKIQSEDEIRSFKIIKN